MISKFSRAMLATFLIASIAGTPIVANALQSETKTRTYSYDKNGNGYIDQDEFTTYFYTRSDLDGDSYLGDEEWKLSSTNWYRPYKDVDLSNYTYWDQDKDKRLDSNEVKTLVEKTGLYSKWDINHDSRVDMEEFSRGTFAAYDDNGDGSLNLDEWKAVLR
jgi:hypothetical protein